MKLSKNKKITKNSITKTYFTIVFSIVGVFFVLFGIMYASVLSPFFLKNTNAKTIVVAKPVEEETLVDTPKHPAGDFMSGLFGPPKKTTFVVMGLDESELLSDVIIAGCFDSETGKISLISIPRDTYVELDKEQTEFLNDHGKYPPSHMKANAVHSYSGKEIGGVMVQSEVEDILGVKIDYYVEVNLSAFREIVDAVGGVYVTVQDGGLNYVDPYQDLVINVPEGRNLLDGATAEGLVRFRHTYPRADLQRIEVQQNFLKEMFSQVVNKDTLIKNAGSISSTILSNVKTNFPVSEIPKYIGSINKLDPENIETYTLPGYPKTIDGQSYYVRNDEEIITLIDEAFNNVEPPTVDVLTIETPAPSSTSINRTSNGSISSKDLKIQVLNGTMTTGIATKTKNYLQDKGFTIDKVGDYKGTKQEKTRIMVSENGMGEDLLEYFKDAKITVDSTIKDADIIIIIGKSESR